MINKFTKKALLNAFIAAHFLFGLVACGYADVPLIEKDRIPLWSELKTLPDPEGRFTPNQISRHFSNGEGRALTYADESYGNWLPYPYWAEFKVSNPLSYPQNRLLSYEVPTQDVVEIWVKRKDGWRLLPERYANQATTLGGGQMFPVWRLSLDAGESQEFLLRLDGYNRMRFPLYLMRDDAFIKQQILLYLTIGFVIAVPSVIALYILTMQGIAGDKSIPLFLVIAACEMLGASWVSGLFTTLIPWLSRATVGWIGWCGYVVMLGLTCWHAQIFMDTKRHDPFAHRVLSAGKWTWLVLVPIFVVLAPEVSRLTLLFGGVLHALLLTFFSIRGYIRKKRPHMRLFIGVWGVYLASGALYIAYRLLNLPVYLPLMINFVQGSLVSALLGWAVCVQVVRRRQKMQVQLDQAQERSKLYAAAQHDLWQPLQSVQRYTSALENADERMRKKLLTSISIALRSVNDFMYTLRDFWMPATSHSLEIQVVQLQELFQNLIEEYRPLAQMMRINLRSHPTSKTVQASTTYLERVVRNLLSNALRYTLPGGRVLLCCRQRGDVTWILCFDTGLGMSSEQAQQCFEAFTRFGDTQRIPEGMGLGLYSVRQLARAMNAQTYLKSIEQRGTVIGIGFVSEPPPFVG